MEKFTELSSRQRQIILAIGRIRFDEFKTAVGDKMLDDPMSLIEALYRQMNDVHNELKAPEKAKFSQEN